MFSKSKDESAGKSQRPAKPGAALSIVAADVRITGNIEASGEIQLDGHVEGDVMCGALSMGESGSVTGQIRADQATIRGTVNGTIRARSLVFERSARITGDIVHESISIEVGAHVEGRIINRADPLSDMGGDALATKLIAVAAQ